MTDATIFDPPTACPRCGAPYVHTMGAIAEYACGFWLDRHGNAFKSPRVCMSNQLAAANERIAELDRRARIAEEALSQIVFNGWSIYCHLEDWKQCPTPANSCFECRIVVAYALAEAAIEEENEQKHKRKAFCIPVEGSDDAV